MHPHDAWLREEAAWAEQREAERLFLLLGLPQLPCPDGKGEYSEKQMYQYALLDRMRDFLAMTAADSHASAPSKE